MEDNPGDARLIVEMLREASDHHFELERVDRLDRALERLSRAGADVILLDLGLPDSQGLATFERTQRMAGGEPIVVISGLDDEQVALAAVRAGAQDYLVKGRIEGHLLARVLRYAIERQRGDEQLREAEQRFRELFDGAPVGLYRMDDTGCFVDANLRLVSKLGYPDRESLVGTKVRDMYADPADFERSHAAAALEGAVVGFNALIRRRDGSTFWADTNGHTIQATPGRARFFEGAVEDITQRRQAEDALRDSERRLRTLFETVNLIVLGLDADGIVDYVNPFFLHLTGYASADVLGKPWFQFLPEQQRPTLQVVFRDLLERDFHPHYENAVVTKSGEERMVAWNNTVLRDAEGRATGSLSVGEDITERNTLELQLRQAQKMEAIGRLAGGVAHDFNNVLTAIFGYVDLLREEMPKDSTAQQDLAEVRKAAERAAALTRQLLAFSRQQVLEPVVLELNELVEDFEKMLHRVIGEDVALRLTLGKDVGNVRADPGQLQQVIMNLVVNARDAMPTGGDLILETANADLTEQYAELHQPVVPGPYILLAVSDTGTGMTPEIKARVFEPFFTTKEKGKGTGLGLSTVYGIVKQSGGYVWLYSEVGRGTTFKIYLPRVDAPPDKLLPVREPGSVAGTETLLLAEDDEMLRPLAKGLLEKLGYTVLDAENAAAALAAARAHHGPIHLLVADVVMPGASGRELARQLEKSHPDTKVLYVSGYTDDAIVHHGMLEPGLNFLQKPFTPATLARKVREVLDAPPK